MTPGEHGHLQAETKSAPRRRRYAAWLRSDPEEDRARLRARRFGMVLMVASAVVTLLILYGTWQALRSL